jgi:hypothetical protein
MIEIKVRSNIDEVARRYGVAESQVDFGAARGLTWTGRDVREAEQREIAAVIKNPTTYTLRSLYLKPATKRDLRAVVWLKGDPYSQHYMLPLIEGGERRMKRFERRLQMLGYMRADERAVPGQGVTLDAYGNVSRGLVVKILSQLKTAVVQGDFSNASQSKRSQAKRANVQYFVSQGPGSQRAAFLGRAKGGGLKAGTQPQHLPRGVWERRQHAWGSSVKPIFLFVPQHRYRKLLRFFEVASSVLRARLSINIDKSMADVMRTARFDVKGGRA